MADTLTEARHGVLRRRIRWIVTATIAYNVIEAVIAVTSGLVASSAALVAFGFDSVIEVLSAAAIAWQFTRRDPERWEAPTLRVIAVSFYLLAGSVTVGAVLSLSGVFRPDHSTVGIVLTAVSVLIMPVLSVAELRTGRELGSSTAIADSRQTLICAALSVAVLGGLLLNSLWGLWWADAVAALIIAIFAVREGTEAWRGDTCATPIGMILEADEDHHHVATEQNSR